MKTIQIKNDYFELHKNNLNLKQISKNKYLYKKKLKYKIKKLLKVICMILFIPISIPVCIVSVIILGFKEMFSGILDCITEILNGSVVKEYLWIMKDDFKSIFDVILEVE